MLKQNGSLPAVLDLKEQFKKWKNISILDLDSNTLGIMKMVTSTKIARKIGQKDA